MYRTITGCIERKWLVVRRSGINELRWHITFQQVINKHIEKHNYKAPETEWVLHWRLYPRNKEVYIEKVNKLIKGEKITVCAAIHSGCVDGIEEFNKFIDQDNVTLQSSPNADEDFCFAFQAKKLIITRGNFGDLLLRTRNNLSVRA